MTKEYLPLGSIVTLKKNQKPMMICGYLAKNAETNEIMDYFGYPYPEGCVDSSVVYQFNQEGIDKLIYLGYQDVETIKYLHALMEKAPELMEQAKNNS